jgi:hypothetical protein
MGVPYTFATASNTIALSQLDTNFATNVTIGTSNVALGNTLSTINNLTLGNVTISSVSAPITPAQGGTGLSSVGTSGNVLTSDGTNWISQAQTNGPMFAASAPAQNVGTGSFVKVTYNYIYFDTNTYFSLVNNRYTPLVAGYYQVSVSAYMSESASSPATDFMAIYKMVLSMQLQVLTLLVNL